jgi:8-oxo-dGTP pyrophosphatase MutT (NUDIX family)
MAAGAGCMFTNGRVVLAGFQPKISKISGFGGASKAYETPFETAIRETLEELLGVTEVPHEVIAKMPECIRHIAYPAYTCFLYSFDDLETILRRARRYYLTSEYYVDFPTTVGDLVLRRHISEGMEVTDLFLTPLNTNTVLCKSFQKDLATVSEICLNNTED